MILDRGTDLLNLKMLLDSPTGPSGIPASRPGEVPMPELPTQPAAIEPARPISGDFPEDLRSFEAFRETH